MNDPQGSAQAAADARPLISIDPGLRGLGVAIWGSDLRLAKAFYVKGAPTTIPAGPGAWRAVWEGLGVHDARYASIDLAIEMPRVYQIRKTPSEDLLQLCAIVGGLAVNAARVKVYRPSEWKGQVPKKVMIQRIIGRLELDEVRRFESPGVTLDHNVWDAVGIGLKHLGRLSPLDHTRKEFR